MISFVCPECSEAVKAPDNAIGKRGRCPKCRRSIEISLEMPIAIGDSIPTDVEDGDGDTYSPDFSLPDWTPPTLPASGTHEKTDDTEENMQPERVAPSVEFAGYDSPGRNEEVVACLSEIRDLLLTQCQPRHSASTESATEYKVLTQKDKWFSGKFDPAKLEEALNAYAEQGWRVRSATTATIPGFGNNREELVVLLER